MISTRSLPTAHVFFTLWCYVYYGYEEIVHTSQVRQTMNYEPLSNTTPAYPYNNFSPYPQVPFIATPPPPEQRRQRPSLLKIFFAIIFMLVLMAFSGLGGYLAHGMGSTPSHRPFPTATAIVITPAVNFGATATAIAVSSDSKAKDAYNSGYQAGYAKGYNDGIKNSQGSTNNSYQQGYNAGVQAAALQITASYNQGKQDGYNSGYTDGYNKGKQDGYNAGYTDGHSKGYTDGWNAEYANIINWLQTKCTKNANGYYPYVYISNGQLYCQ